MYGTAYLERSQNDLLELGLYSYHKVVRNQTQVIKPGGNQLLNCRDCLNSAF